MKALLLTWLCLVGAARAADQNDCLVRTLLQPGGETWVGQKIPFIIQILAPGYFSDSPVFDLPKIPGVLILPSTGTPIVASEQIHGRTFFSQRHELTIFSRQAGAIKVPSFEIRFAIKLSPLDRDSLPTAVHTPEVSLTIQQPPGSISGQDIITSVDLKLEETWKPEPGPQAKAGDAFVRSLVWSASDVPGMALPPLDQATISGLGIYPGEPLVEDIESRSGDQHKRTEVVTYVCKTGGHFTIPGRSIRWWNPEQNEMKQIMLPDRSFIVKVPPSPPETLLHRLQKFFRLHGIAVGGTVISIVLLVVFFRITRRFWAHFFRQFLPRHLSPLNPP